MNEVLFKSILAMDSYNRGYDRAIELDTVLNTTQIGNATIIKNSSAEFQNADAAIGFYALAYDTDGDGKGDVISYRGTDAQP